MGEIVVQRGSTVGRSPGEDLASPSIRVHRGSITGGVAANVILDEAGVSIQDEANVDLLDET